MLWQTLKLQTNTHGKTLCPLITVIIVGHKNSHIVHFFYHMQQETKESAIINNAYLPQQIFPRKLFIITNFVPQQINYAAEYLMPIFLDFLFF